MAETHGGHENRFQSGINTQTFERAAGGVLAVGSLVTLIGGLLHPPGASSVSVISGNMTRWFVSHWLFAGGVFLVGLGSLLVVFSQSALAANWVALAAWSGVALSSVPVMVFMIGEATVLPQLAAGGATAEFASWRVFIEMGAIASLLPVSVGLLLVAWTRTRAQTLRTPVWVAWGAVLAFVLGLIWIVGFGVLDVEALGPLFLVELLGFIWLGWLGLDLARSEVAAREESVEVSQTPE